MRRVEKKPEPSSEARLAALRNCEGSLTAFISECYPDEGIKRDLESYKDFQCFMAARFPDDRTLNDFAYEHSLESDRQDYLYFYAMLS